MRHRPARHTRGFVTRVAVASAASLAVVASGGTVALADETTPNDEIDPSSLTTETVTGEEQVSTDGDAPADLEVPAEDDAAPELEGETAPEAEQAPDDDPGTDLEGGGDVEDVDEVDPPVVTPLYGSQKIRIGVQQADGSYLPEGTSFAGTTMSITISGGQDSEGAPLADASTTCTVPTASSTCIPADFVNSDGTLDLDAGRTAVVTPTSVPAGLVIAPASQTVLPELCPIIGVEGEQICIPSGTKFLNFDVSAVPEAVSAATTEGQPVTIDVVGPLDVGPDNAVTGVTVTSQSPNGTAVVTGELPPVAEEPEEPVLPDDTIARAAAAAPVAEAAPSGSSRIVFTPNAGFVGTTTFGYAVATQNGTVTGVATITVNAAAVVTPPVVTPPDVTSPTGTGQAGNIGTASRFRSADGTLPSTGGPAEELLALGALLVVAGAGAMATRRRADRGLVG